MIYCKNCGTAHECTICPNCHGIAMPMTTAANPVPSSDWVGELEAALAHLMKAQNDLAKTQSPLWLESVPIGVWLRDAIASERGSSPTVAVSDKAAPGGTP